MKILIPSNEKSMDSSVCQSFGRAPYFLIYDTNSKEDIYIDNSATASLGGAGIKAAQTVVDNNVYAVLTPRCGENAASVLKTANIKIFKTKNSSIKDNIIAFNEDKLSLLSEIHAGFHNHGDK